MSIKYNKQVNKLTKISCPLCSDNLGYELRDKIYLFLCQACGYSNTALMGYSLEDSYKWIIKHKRKPTSNRSGGFKTKGSKALHIDSLALENDPKIIANTKKVTDIPPSNIPRVLHPILGTRGHLPVYYKKLAKKLPKSGNDIDEFIKLTGLRRKLREKGINNLYEYQERAYNEILAGSNIVVSAPTGLGKTESFIIPIIYSILNIEPNPNKRSNTSTLLVYPTKALAADQREKVQYYCKGLGIRVAVYDGDTPQNERRDLYRNPVDILITNADMIHYHLTSNMDFKAMISNVKFLVLDEIHLCVGTFGTNVLWIIRRLRRFCTGLQCIGASATISNAKEFAELLFDEPVVHISAGTARKSDVHLSMLYPKERSNLSTIRAVSSEFIENNHKTLIFGNSHKSAEIINLMLCQQGYRVDIHRAGLSVKHRNQVEKGFKSNSLDALVSTPTLELGIDIGNLDSVISQLTNLTRFVQRIGRAGREGQASYATLVLNGDDPISAFYARNPDEYLTDLLPAYVEPNNELISYFQLLSMIIDKPLQKNEMIHYIDIIEKLENDKLVIRRDGMVEIRDRYKANEKLRRFSIRGTGNSVSILYNRDVIGSRALPIALKELHEGAIYLHGGKAYKVKKYDSQNRVASMLKIGSITEKTQAIRSMEPDILSITDETEIDGLAVAFLDLRLTEYVHGYIVQNVFTNDIKSKKVLDTPISYTYDTKGFALVVPQPSDFVAHLNADDKKQVLGGTYHAIEHVLIESGNSLTGGGSTQIGGLSIGDTGLMFIYDGNEGGSGLSRLLFDALPKGLTRSLKIMQDCPCKQVDGCPRCTYSYQCGNNNQPLNRLGGVESLLRFGRDSTELDLDFKGKESFIAFPDQAEY